MNDPKTVPPIKVTQNPHHVVIGPGAAREAGFHAAQLGGRRALVIGGTRAIEAIRPALLPSLAEREIAYHVEQGDHVRQTRESVDALVAIAREQRAELVIAGGGGTVMDV